MIDISTWRVRIGVYSGGKRPKKRNQERTTSIGRCNENTKNGLSTILTICAFCFVLNTFSEMKNSHQTLATETFETHVNPFIAYLLIIGGVETNPGPKTVSLYISLLYIKHIDNLQRKRNTHLYQINDRTNTYHILKRKVQILRK